MIHRSLKQTAAILLSLHSVSITSAFSSSNMLIRRTPEQVQLEIKDPVDPTALSQAKSILNDLRPGGTQTACSPDALLSIAHRLGDIPPEGSSYIVPPSSCKEAFDSLTDDERKSLLNIHQRVKVFAEAQRKSVADMEVDIPGGKAGQSVSPCRGTLQLYIFVLFLFIAVLL